MPDLSDHTLIGNSRSAALVSKTGSIDWCCLPEFHSPAIFAALLDEQRGGFFSIRPANIFQSAQRYLPDTNVAETSFETDQGRVRVTDAFVALTETEKTQHLFPDHEILRIVEGVSGIVQIRVDYVPRIFYGKRAAQLKDHKEFGIHFSLKENTYVLLTTLERSRMKFKNDEKNSVTAEFYIKQGEQIFFSLSCSSQSPAIIPELKITGWQRMEKTINFWRSWIGKCKYKGLYSNEVKRSALVLKLLTHAPSGAIIAAPTTSLPEEVGGVRNWDYRYCWLRDASFTIRALLKLGFDKEAEAYMNWILHATRLTRPELQVVYSVYGHAKLKEEILGFLQGYKNSKPVRIGNKADGQFQLDVYGEVLDALYAYSNIVKDFDNDTRKFTLGLGRVLCSLWDEPDNGIWEVRSSCVHHTHSKVMAWVGFDRLIKLCKKYNWKNAPVEKFEKAAGSIKKLVEEFGFNKEINSYTRELKGDSLDASLLVLSLVDYCDASSPIMTSTVQAIYKGLTKNNLVYRYQNIEDGITGREGSFAVCTFWLVENLARSGRLEKATEVFESMLKHASPAGLFSEEIDPETFELLGNYPQAFTHIGLINAALSLNAAHEKGRSVI